MAIILSIVIIIVLFCFWYIHKKNKLKMIQNELIKNDNARSRAKEYERSVQESLKNRGNVIKPEGDKF